MAELALSATALALAWKAILDFGVLVTDMLDNDVRRRELLAVKLEASQHRLRDWGDFWGPDRPDGLFHAFEPTRKALIVKIIVTLRDSRQEAIARLRGHYGLFAEGDEEEEEGAEKRSSRLRDRIRGASKRAKDKSVWLVRDRAVLTDLVNETVDLHEHLNYLTSMSPKFLLGSLQHLRPPAAATADAADASLESSLAHLREHAQSGTTIIQQQQHHHHLPPSPSTPLHSSPLTPFPPPSPTSSTATSSSPSIDRQTLVSFSTKSIPTHHQAAHVQTLIDAALHADADPRIPARLAAWWNDPAPALLLLECPDEAEDATAQAACALLYYLAACRKLVYAFPPPPLLAGKEEEEEGKGGRGRVERFAEMLRVLVEGAVALDGGDGGDGGGRRGEEVSLPDGGSDAQQAGLVRFFLDLVRSAAAAAAATDSSEDGAGRVLVVIEGMDGLIGDGYDDDDDDGAVGELVQALVGGLSELCGGGGSVEGKGEEGGVDLKVLIGWKGHAMGLYGCVDDREVVDFTDHGAERESFVEGLAVGLRG